MRNHHLHQIPRPFGRGDCARVIRIVRSRRCNNQRFMRHEALSVMKTYVSYCMWTLFLDIPSADSGEPEDVEGARWMPWHPEPKKDVASCDKPRGGANGLRSADLRMGEPARGHARARPPERIGRDGATGGTETSKYPEEEKSNENARVAASESARAQTGGAVEPRRAGPPGLRGMRGEGSSPPGRLQTARAAERHGKAGDTG